MASDRKSNCDLLSHLGFDVLGHLEDLKSKGVHSVDIEDFAPATPTALRGWEDANFPYRLPVELRAFLGASDGYSLTWTAKHDNATERGGLEVVTGRIQINCLSAITRLPLDSDDLSNIASSRAREPALAAATKSSSKEHRVPQYSTEDVSAEATTTLAPGGCDKAYGIGAFSLDSLCGVGEVALVYRGAPLKNGISRNGAGSGGKGKRTSVTHLTSPEVWLQDMSCRWHFLADSFTSYFRMMAVHLGILGWQQAFSPVGLSPSTKQCMRLYCPDRLLFDELEWEKEKEARKSAKAAAIGRN